MIEQMLTTRWSEAARVGQTLREYPRPQLVRNDWISLNGVWQYTITNGEETVMTGDILVPFAPEAMLSGVNHILQPNETLRYEAKFDLPKGWCSTGHILLHFGAVDQVCRVWVNGQEVGGHEGGYTAFTIDITDAIHSDENMLALEVHDATEHAPYGRGKQRLQRKGDFNTLFYTPVSGIWKSVWMERVPATYIERLQITPLYDDAAVSIAITSNAPAEGEIVISLHGDVVARQTIDTRCDHYVIGLSDFAEWTPEQPVLYDLEIRYGEDQVTSYFGMRKVEIRRDAQGILRFYLNNEATFMNGVLDQGYWPDGLLTAPSDEAYVHDIETLRGMGYNLIRQHIKVEPERFYYHCDRLGMLVWQDMPNGGGRYCHPFVTVLPNVWPWIGRHVRDHHYRLFARVDEAGRQIYDQELEEIVQELYNHPSIVGWVPFNEGWGQFDARKVTARLRELDDTRLIDEACGWYDQGGGDMLAIHNYWRRLRVWPQQDRVVALTEYGGYALPVPGHMYSERGAGYKDYRTSEELTDAYVGLLERDILPNLEHGLSAAVYTQMSDVEEECNGLVTYDRAVCKMDAERLRAVHRRIYERFADLTKVQKSE